MVATELSEIEECKSMVDADDSYRIMVMENRLGKPVYLFELETISGAELISRLNCNIEKKHEKI